MKTNVSEEELPNKRGKARTNLFFIASLSARGISTPVTVRNLSPSGALIEGAVLPPAGTIVHLRRGSLCVDGEIAWCRAGQAGIAFASAISVRDWLPGAKSTTQKQIDEVVHELRMKGAVQWDSAPSPPEPAKAMIAEEIAQLRGLLEEIAIALADDPQMVAAHFDKLQMLDIAAGRVGRLEAQIKRL